MGAAWVINLAVAKCVIRRRSKDTAEEAPAQDRVPAANAGT